MVTYDKQQLQVRENFPNKDKVALDKI